MESRFCDSKGFFLNLYVRASVFQLLLDDMLEAVERADAVITGLLDFSAPRELNLSQSNLNELVERSAKMASENPAG